jgi:hypothetical protein
VAAVLLSWPQLTMFAKGVAACTGLAAGHILDLCVYYCLHAGTALLSKFNRRGKPHHHTVPSRRQMVLGLAISSTTALTLGTLLFLTFLHIFLGLLFATALVAYSCASESARAVDILCVKSCDLTLTSMECDMNRLENSGSAISQSHLRVRHCASACTDATLTGKQASLTTSDCDFGSPHADTTSCSCLMSRGSVVICVMLVSTTLALPSAVATAQSRWSPQSMEDFIPAASMVLWACLLSVACSSQSCQQSVDFSTVPSPSTMHSSCTSKSQATKGCKFSQLAFSQVSSACHRWIMYMNTSMLRIHLALLAVDIDVERCLLVILWKHVTVKIACRHGLRAI